MTETSIKVVVRIRPINETDYKQARGVRASGPEICINLKRDGQTIELIKDPFSSRRFKYEHVFNALSTQESVYQYSCSDLVKSFIRGYNACLLCYGQTGTGNRFKFTSTINICQEKLILCLEEWINGMTRWRSLLDLFKGP
jgi:hypothetical protein